MQKKKNKILVIGLNPAWQKILVFEALIKGKVNRALNMHAFGSGKGANYAKIAIQCGDEPTLVQFVGGYTGEMLIDSLNESEIKIINQKVPQQTRTCITLLSSMADATELIEPSPKVETKDVEELLEKAKAALPENDAVAICGTFPPGVTIDFYAEIAKLAKKDNKPLLVDSYKGITPLLETGIDILKINRRELAVLSENEDVYEGGRMIREKYPVKIVAVTDGPDNAFLFTDDGGADFPVPYIDTVVNPIGAGDTVSAVLFSEYLKGTPVDRAFIKALQAGSERCKTLRMRQVIKS